MDTETMLRLIKSIEDLLEYMQLYEKKEPEMEVKLWQWRRDLIRQVDAY